jgi:hypothetical protein
MGKIPRHVANKISYGVELFLKRQNNVEHELDQIYITDESLVVKKSNGYATKLSSYAKCPQFY